MSKNCSAARTCSHLCSNLWQSPSAKGNRIKVEAHTDNKRVVNGGHFEYAKHQFTPPECINERKIKIFISFPCCCCATSCLSPFSTVKDSYVVVVVVVRATIAYWIFYATECLSVANPLWLKSFLLIQ